MFDRQASLQKQVSVMSEGGEESHQGLKRMASKKEQEEWDKEIPDVCLFVCVCWGVCDPCIPENPDLMYL